MVNQEILSHLLCGYLHQPRLGRRHVSSRIFGLGLLVLGGALLAHSLKFVEIPWDLIWPLAIAGAGVYLIWNVAFVWRRPSFRNAPASGTVANKVFLGEVKETCKSPVFTGGEAAVFMGSYELDLTRAAIEGEEAHLFARVAMGEVRLIVPDRWRDSVKGLPILGSVEDRTRQLPDGDDQRPTLVINAAVVLGSLEIMS